jgi:single-strand DNA-binding protein
MSTKITIAGNCADAPELRFTTDGKATARVRVAVNHRYQNTSGDWVDGPVSWHTVLAWGSLAENLVSSVDKGDRVVVHGRLAQRDYTTESGEKRSVWEVTAEDVGLSLRHAPAPATRVTTVVSPAQ